MGRFNHGILIYNDNAGQKETEEILGKCLPVLAGGIEELTLLKTEGPGHASELCRKHGSETDVVVILGGDGTVHECINGLAPLPKRPALAILPGGTCNDFSRTLNMPQDILEAAKAIASGNLVPVDALKIDGSYSLNFWGTGLITEASNNIKESEKALLGKISYYLGAMRTMKQMEQFSYSVKCGGSHFEGEAVMILVANGCYIGTNRLPFPNIKPDDGLADVFIIKNTNLALVRDLLTKDITLEAEEEKSEIFHCAGSEITIETKEKMKADTDGEVYLETPANILVLKHHFQAVAPAPQK